MQRLTVVVVLHLTKSTSDVMFTDMLTSYNFCGSPSIVVKLLSDLPNLPTKQSTTTGSTEVYANTALRPTRLLK